MSIEERKLISFETLQNASLRKANNLRRKLSSSLSSKKLKSVGHPVIVRELDGNIRLWNPSAEEFYGWSPEQAVGSVSHRLLKTQFPCSLRTINHELLRRGFWEGELVHTLRNGKQVFVNSRWELQTDKSGSSITVYEINDKLDPPCSSLLGNFLGNSKGALLLEFLSRNIWWWITPLVLMLLGVIVVMSLGNSIPFTISGFNTVTQ